MFGFKRKYYYVIRSVVEDVADDEISYYPVYQAYEIIFKTAHKAGINDVSIEIQKNEREMMICLKSRSRQKVDNFISDFLIKNGDNFIITQPKWRNGKDYFI